MNGCFCLFLCNYFVQVSANTAEFIGGIVENILLPQSGLKRRVSELTAQPRHHHYTQTPTNPNTPLRDLFSSFWALLL